MKIFRVVNTDQLKTYALNKVERVTYKNKDYIVSRFIDAPKTNVLTLKKQKIVLDLISKGVSLEEISSIIAVPLHVINMWLSHAQMGKKNGGC